MHGGGARLHSAIDAELRVRGADLVVFAAADEAAGGDRAAAVAGLDDAFALVELEPGVPGDRAGGGCRQDFEYVEVEVKWIGSGRLPQLLDKGPHGVGHLPGVAEVVEYAAAAWVVAADHEHAA